MFFMTKIIYIYIHTHTHTHTHTIFGWINISNIISEKYSEKKITQDKGTGNPLQAGEFI